MAIDYNALVVFLAVAREGSFVAAARRMSVPASTVSRRVADLEAGFRVQLLRRSTRTVSLTDEGLALVERCSELINSIDEAAQSLVESGTADRLSGRLRVTAPVLAGAETFGPWLLAFAMEHPDIELELRFTNTTLDLVEDGIDLAFRLGPLRDGRLIARRLWSVPYGIFVHTGLWERIGRPALVHPRDLNEYPQVVTPPILSWGFVHATGEEAAVTPRRPAAIVNDLRLGLHAMRGGLGLGYLPVGLVGSEPDPSVVEIVMEGWRTPTRDMYAVYPPMRHLSPKVRAVINYVLARRGQLDQTGHVISASSH